MLIILLVWLALSVGFVIGALWKAALSERDADEAFERGWREGVKRATSWERHG